jgi:hypothetical protein
MASIRLEIRSVAILGALVEVVVLGNQLLELRLHVDNLLGRKFKLDYGHTGGLEMGEKPYFGRLEEHQRAAFAIRATRCSPDAVDIISRIIRGVELKNPINIWDL